MQWLRRGVLLLLWGGLGILAITALASFYVDLAWFAELNALPVLWTRVFARWGLGLGAFVFALAVVGVNIRACWRGADPAWAWAIALGLSGCLAWFLSQHWFTLLLWLHQVPVGESDPIFNRDLGFFLFSLPFWEKLQHWCFNLVLLTLVAVALIYFVELGLSEQRLTLALSLFAQRHLLILGGALFLLRAWGHWLERYKLLYSTRGVVFGAGFTDVHATLPATTLMSGVAFLTALGFWALARQGIRLNLPLFKSWCPPWGSSLLAPALLWGAYLGFGLLTTRLYPHLVQTFLVTPNELELERPYLEHNIRFTRAGFGLTQVEVKPFPEEGSLTWEILQQNQSTLSNVRLWDAEPLLATYRQLQEIRPYYQFPYVDVDRYRIGGELRQVMHAARELDFAQVPPAAQTWVNRRFFYTHGYGLTLSPVNVVTPEGLPDFFLADIPPRISPRYPEVAEVLQVDQPALYYGELTTTEVFVGAEARELDYPAADHYVYSSYRGTGGVPIPHLWQRFLYAWHFRDLRILLSRELSPNTRFLYRRQIRERVRQVMPFLLYDQDPYLVIQGGKLYWFFDAYTISRYYPYSEYLPDFPFNYIRNSVKAVLDAYNGSIDWYIADPQDPLIQAYARIYPTLFKPLEAMPEPLRQHLRYPQDLFRLQAQQFATYHMTDPRLFYNREDQWQIPNQFRKGRRLPMQPQYLILTLPEERQKGSPNEPEFVLLSPFTPLNKQNMVAWMAARCDGENYGKLLVYEFSKQRLIYGPEQVEARVNQDPAISEQIALWNEHGSRVNLGTLLVIPIETSLLYVQPLYLEAEQSRLPQLTRVIAAYEDRVVMEPTLAQALEALFSPTLR
ncbi:UPF0182 family protein [Synechococcus sp. R70.1]|uniref:UPF0182 family membrane protein n=1 Tax=Synechococcus sp. R70.1 TaxID=2964531 RepID=UPI0039C28885